MKKLTFIVSLITEKNAYQKDQATAARAAANRLGADVRVLFADGDAVTQSEQLLKVIQSSSEDARPAGIVCHPVGTPLDRVAREAAARGIGWALYILGPSTNPVFKLRQAGMQSTKPANIQIITLRGNLTDQSGYDAVTSWLRLPTSRTTRVDLVAGQNDDMAIGARRAFEEAMSGDEREQ